jgi:hypothetical protein
MKDNMIRFPRLPCQALNHGCPGHNGCPRLQEGHPCPLRSSMELERLAFRPNPNRSQRRRNVVYFGTLA